MSNYNGLVLNRVRVGIRSNLKRIVFNHLTNTNRFKVEEHMESRIYINVWINVSTFVKDFGLAYRSNRRATNKELNQAYGKVTL